MSSQGPAIVHYEVYALNGQRWTLHARFHKDEKEEALIEAKSIENSLGFCAKVIRETYYPGNNASEEILVYATDKNFRPRSQAPVYRPKAYARGEPGFDAEIATPDFRTVQKAKITGSMGVLVKLFLVVVAALAIASGGAAIINNFLAKFPSLVTANSASPLTFITFVIIFLAAGVPLAMTVVGWHDGHSKADANRKSPPSSVKPKEVKAPAEEMQAIDTSPEEQVETSEVEAPPQLQDAPVAEEQPNSEPDSTPDVESQADTDVAASAEKDADPLESFRMLMIRFLSSLLTEVKKVRPALDAYNIFGIDLMLAGAIDVLGTQNHLDLDDKRAILRTTIEVMGTKGETAKAFADRYEDYLFEPKYMSMVLVGRSNMEALLGGADLALSQVSRVFESWNKPQQSAPTSSHIVTVLFTDMVGSTDLTQARGDHVAQDIVRRHNTIVRTALLEFSGKEIKHTGDGIMASFASASNGVEAAIVIQRACATHNEKHPDLPLHLRIGLNAGEPIEEEDDLFGSTVQLSARVCAEAATDEILCTNVVRELSSGKDLPFVLTGERELKGFKDPIALYKILWTAKSGGGTPRSGKKEPKPKTAAKVATRTGLANLER